ncbi:MAG: S-layer protein [Methanolinea sp.]|nr:S-layer protein [Methanolinea sp.]
MTIIGQYLRFAVLCAVAVSFLTVPVLAGEKFMSGEPDLSASLEGANEFSPGSDTTLGVVIQNRGVNEIKIVQSKLADSEERPNTAKLVSARLLPGDAPLQVKSDPQMVGDIPGETKVTVPFAVKFDRNATGGTYVLPLEIHYTYLFDAEQASSETIIYHYKTADLTIPLEVKVRSEVILEVRSLVAGNITAGNEEYLDLALRNTGSLAGTGSIARIGQSGESPIVPVDGSAYIGNFSPGSVVPCRFKIRATDQAREGTYPLDVWIEYRDPNGDLMQTRPATIGVPVRGKIDFTLLSGPFRILRGGGETLLVTYLNSGPATVYSAQARIIALDPFTSSKDISYLGDLGPGEQASARFEIAADKSATVKEYGLDSEIRYRDALGNNLISDPIVVRVEVLPRTGLDAVISSPVLMSIIAAAVIGAGYYLYTMRKKTPPGPGEGKQEERKE